MSPPLQNLPGGSHGAILLGLPPHFASISLRTLLIWPCGGLLPGLVGLRSHEQLEVGTVFDPAFPVPAFPGPRNQLSKRGRPVHSQSIPGGSASEAAVSHKTSGVNQKIRGSRSSV